MSRAQTYHVVPHDGTWAVRTDSTKTVRTFETKRAALDEARKLVREQKDASKIVVHGKSGQIIQSTSVKSELSDKTIRDAVRSLINPQNGASVKSKPSANSKTMRASKR